MIEFQGKKHASFDEIREFLNGSMINFVKLNEDNKKPFDKKELLGFRSFHRFLIDQLDLAEKIK